MQFEIIHLPKEKWKGQMLPMQYTASAYYDVCVRRRGDNFSVDFICKPLARTVTHTPEQYDFPDRLYADHWPGAWAWGILQNNTLIAAIETCPEDWSNRLRVTELWVARHWRRQGLGRALLDLAKEQARLEHRRAVILETQSCNPAAIGFYLHEGFTLSGFDTCCYTNDDLTRGEVRIELGWFPEKAASPERSLVLRRETQAEQTQTEQMIRRAFWNKYKPGCDEHYLVHLLREDPAFLPAFSRVAVSDGSVIGCIFYSAARICDGMREYPILTFGPLCVDPDWQDCGVGRRLLTETMRLAAEAGWPGIVIFGEPAYYHRFGFSSCEHFGITTADGKNPEAFMAVELIPNGLKDLHGAFHEAPVFQRLSPQAVTAAGRCFPVSDQTAASRPAFSRMTN